MLSDSVISVLFTGSELALLLYTSAYTSHASSVKWTKPLEPTPVFRTTP